MAKLLVSGAKNRPDAAAISNGILTVAGLLLLVDMETDEVEVLLEYQCGAPEFPEEDLGMSFKCPAIIGDELVVPTHNGLLFVNPADWSVNRILRLPFFNDLHSVMPCGDNILVTSTGLDAVFEITTDGEIVNEWNAEGPGSDGIWDRFSKDEDYSCVASTKPHRIHPNFASKINDDVWVTRFERKDAISLTNPDKPPISLEAGRPHDGHYIGGQLFFTTVNGHVYVADPGTSAIQQHIDLNETKRGIRPLGWCRGLTFHGDDLVLAFSRLRPTKYTDNLSWIKDIKRNVGLSACHPTRLCLYEGRSAKLKKEINLEPYGINMVFSVSQWG